MPLHLLLLSALLASPAPRIDETFPPPPGADRRRPDRTQEQVEGGVITHLAFSADGRTLATTAAGPGGDRQVRVWSARTSGKEAGQLLRTLRTKQRGAAALAEAGFATVGTPTASLLGPGKSTVRLAGEPGAAPRELPVAGHRGPITALAVSRKGAELATGGADGTIRIWDVATGALLAIQEGHSGPVLAVAFNPNGQKLVSSGRDRTLRTWTVPLPPLPEDDLARIAAAVPERSRVAPLKPRKLLVFWRADAILHKSGVPAVNHAIELMGKKTGAFVAHFSRDYEVLSDEALAGYDALVLNSTAHLALPDEHKKRALLNFARRGGGVVGIHAAIDMFKDWPEGAGLVGATFASHPWGPSGTWKVKLDHPQHPLLAAFGGQGLSIKDEIYELGPPYGRGDRQVLMSLDLSDAATAAVKPHYRTDGDFAISWIKPYGQGRVFYCMFGHVARPFHDRRVQAYYLDGIQYALGDLLIPERLPRAASAAVGHSVR